MGNTQHKPWNRHAPEIAFVDKVMQDSVYRWNYDKVVWEVRPPTFSSDMTITRWEYGTNSLFARVLADDGYNYRLNFDSIAWLIENSSINQNYIPKHTYRFHKQGSSYMIKLEVEE